MTLPHLYTTHPDKSGTPWIHNYNVEFDFHGPFRLAFNPLNNTIYCYYGELMVHLNDDKPYVRYYYIPEAFFCFTPIHIVTHRLTRIWNQPETLEITQELTSYPFFNHYNDAATYVKNFSSPTLLPPQFIDLGTDILNAIPHLPSVPQEYLFSTNPFLLHLAKSYYQDLPPTSTPSAIPSHRTLN